jgi:hypothetical protein
MIPTTLAEEWRRQRDLHRWLVLASDAIDTTLAAHCDSNEAVAMALMGFLGVAAKTLQVRHGLSPSILHENLARAIGGPNVN